LGQGDPTRRPQYRAAAREGLNQPAARNGVRARSSTRAHLPF
jgi:hypothetical protein